MVTVAASLARTRSEGMMDEQRHTHTQANSHTRTHTHTHSHTHAHALTNTETHLRTHVLTRTPRRESKQHTADDSSFASHSSTATSEEMMSRTYLHSAAGRCRNRLGGWASGSYRRTGPRCLWLWSALGERGSGYARRLGLG